MSCSGVPPHYVKDSATYCHVVKLNATVLDLSRYTDATTCPVFGTSEDLVHVIDTSSNELRGPPPVEGYAVALERRRSSRSGMIQRSSVAATESLVTGFVR